MALSTEEQETVIRFDRNGDVAHIYTSDSTIMTKLDKIYTRVNEHKSDGETVAVDYDVDKKLVSFRSKRMKRNLTDEQRKAISERMKRARASKE